MLTVELSTLSDELVEQATLQRLPPGWTLETHQDEESRYWVALIFNEEGLQQWRMEDITLKQVLLHAVGWLTLRNYKLPEGSPWVRRFDEITTERLHEAAYRATGPEEVPDLDPVELQSVYKLKR